MTDLTSSIWIAAPELTLALGALVLLTIGALLGEKSSGLVSLLAGVVLVLGAFAAAFAPLGRLFGGALTMDPMAAYAKVVMFSGAAVALVLGHGWMDRKAQRRFEFPILILLATAGMSMMVSAGDMIALYVGIELQSLALYVLTAFNRDDARGSEAGLKYFVLGALSSGLLLYGISLLYGFSGHMDFVGIATAVGVAPGAGLIFGLVFVVCGIAFKVSAAPFHMWTPDVYEGAPTPVTAFIAGAPKVAAMVLFARVLLEAFPAAIAQWRQVVLAVAVLSFVVGALGGLMQKDMKRLLAYSSIANIGYALLAIAAGQSVGLQALLVFMTLYMIDVTGLFACVLALARGGRPLTRIADLAGLKRERPGLAVALTALSLSVLGMPPFSGFWAKFYVFKAALQAGLWPFAVGGLVASVVAAFYYLRIIKVMWFDEAPASVDSAPAEARWVAFASAAFAFPLVMVALAALDPAAAHAAAALGLK